MTLFLIGLGVFVLISAYFFFSDYITLFKKSHVNVSSSVVDPAMETETVKPTSKGRKAKATKEKKIENESVLSNTVTSLEVIKKEKVKAETPDLVKSKKGRKKKN